MLALAPAPAASAVTLAPGDIVVTIKGDGAPGAVERIDPVTGVRTRIAGGYPVVTPTGVAVERGGTLVVADQGASAGVLRIDPASGAVTPLSIGGLLSQPAALALEADGSIVAVDSSSRAVIRVNPQSGAQTLISAGGLLDGPLGVAVEADGGILVGDFTDCPTTCANDDGRLVRVNPVTGAQTLVTEIDDIYPSCPTAEPCGLSKPFGVAVESDGGILVTSFPHGFYFDGVYRVNPVTGADTKLFTGNCETLDQSCDPVGVAVESDGDILLAGRGPTRDDGAITRVDPVTGVGTLLVHAHYRYDEFSVRGIAVVPTRFDFTGFAAPIDNDVVNSAKAGQTIPVTYRLTAPDGTPVSDPASFKELTSQSGGGVCAGLPQDAIEYYSGGSGLQYLGDGNWRFNWKTPKSYAGQCRTMTLRLADNTTHTANFQFK
jgi:hypothetical protein